MINRFEPPGPIDVTGNRKKRAVQKAVTITAGLAVIAFLGWLAIQKINQARQDEIAVLMKNRQWSEAARRIYEKSQKEDFSNLRLLSYGVAVNFGLREERISLPELPHYSYRQRLNELDTTGIFERETFYLLFSLFPESAHFLQELCAFSRDHAPHISESKILHAVQNALSSGATWYMADDGCMERILAEDSPMAILTASVSGDNLILRQKPTRQSSQIARLGKETPLLVLNRSDQQELIGNKKAYWFEVLTKEQTRGWVFGGYLELHAAQSNGEY